MSDEFLTIESIRNVFNEIGVPHDFTKHLNIREIFESYGSFKDKIKDYAIKNKDIHLAYEIIYFYEDKEWIKEIIENHELGAKFAYYMLCNYEHGLSFPDKEDYREWAEKIIEEKGDSYAAYGMWLDCKSSAEWLKKVIEKNGDLEYAYIFASTKPKEENLKWLEGLIEESGCSYWAFKYFEKFGNHNFCKKVIKKDKGIEGIRFAIRMLKDYNDFDEEWIKNELERTKNPYYVYESCKDVIFDREWAEKVIEKSDHESKKYYALHMKKNCGSSQEWYDRIMGSSLQGKE